VIPVSPETGRATGPFLKIVKAELDHEPLPGWSPDGSAIVYFYDWKLWTVKPDGSDLKKIKDNKSLEVGPVWSPDGKIIAFGSGDKNLMLYNVKSDQFSELAITGRRSFPVWSPDGKWILDKATGLHFYNLADKTEFKFPLLKGIGGFFSWRADGNKLLFYASSYKNDLFLRIAPANGGPSFEPVPNLSSEDVTWWRNDSKLLAVPGMDENGDFAIRITPLTGGRSDIIQLNNIPGSKPSPLNITSDFGQIVFSVRLSNGNENLYVVPVSADDSKTTGPPLKLFEKKWKERTYYYFSADGKKLAFVRDNNIWIATTNGDEPILASDFKGEVEYLRWTTDGKALLFPSSSDPISSGWKLMEDPGPKSKIIKLMDEGKEITCRHWNIAISPDNSKIAVLTDQQIKIIPVDETKSGRILNIGNLGLKDCGELNWSPDGKSLAFIGSKEMEDKVSFPDGKFLIYSVPVDGGIPVRVAPDDDGDFLKVFLSWSPDSKWIAYSANRAVKIRPESAIWEADFDEVLEKMDK
jgi:Tol biopolymer transport system component